MSINFGQLGGVKIFPERTRDEIDIILISEPDASPNDETCDVDTFSCGTCHQTWTDLSSFLDHKRTKVCDKLKLSEVFDLPEACGGSVTADGDNGSADERQFELIERVQLDENVIQSCLVEALDHEVVPIDFAVEDDHVIDVFVDDEASNSDVTDGNDSTHFALQLENNIEPDSYHRLACSQCSKCIYLHLSRKNDHLCLLIQSFFQALFSKSFFSSQKKSSGRNTTWRLTNELTQASVPSDVRCVQWRSLRTRT